MTFVQYKVISKLTKNYFWLQKKSYKHSMKDKLTVLRDLVSNTSVASFKDILSSAIPAHTPKHNIGKICLLYKHNNEKTIWIIFSFLFTLVGIVRIRFRFFRVIVSFGGIGKDQSGLSLTPSAFDFAESCTRSWYRFLLGIPVGCNLLHFQAFVTNNSEWMHWNSQTNTLSARFELVNFAAGCLLKSFAEQES